MDVGRCVLSAWVLIGFVVFIQTDAHGNTTEDDRSGRSKRHGYCRTLPPIRCTFSKYRSADGTCNNRKMPYWGSAGTPMMRVLPSEYEKVTPTHTTPRLLDISGRPLPSPRTVSNHIHNTRGSHRFLRRFSNAHQAFGQFFDHDMNFTPMETNPDKSTVKNCCRRYNPLKIYEETKSPCWPIPVTSQDDVFTHRNCMEFVRSKPSELCHSSPGNPLAWEQRNDVTAWIDASMVYGSSREVQKELRSGHQGKMKVKRHDLLPESQNGMCLERLPLTPLRGNFYCLKAGDDRINEHPALSTFHVMFVRLHNDICDKLAQLHRPWDDERIFQEARKIVGAIIQVIAFKEWIPHLLGPQIVKKYQLAYFERHFRYNDSLNPSMLNEFATAAFRYGHSQVPDSFTVGDRKVELKVMFHNPSFLEQMNGQGLDRFASGMLKDHTHVADRFFSDGLANKMFEIPGTFPGLDLAAINIQRGRDHGFPGYHAYREHYGSPPITIGREGAENKNLLQYVYRHLNDVDLYTGALLEKILPGAMVGPTFANIIGDVFHKLKFGDRFWWQAPGVFTYAQQLELSRVTIAKVLCQTTRLERDQTQISGFESPSYWNPVLKCYQIMRRSAFSTSRFSVAGIDLLRWRY